MVETYEQLEQRALAKTLEMVKDQSPLFNIFPTLEAVRQVLSFEGWDIVKRVPPESESGQ